MSPARRTLAVASSDGVSIRLETGGAGPDLLLVHGTGTRRHLWSPVRHALERHFTVHAMDRRGYGDSGDTTPYAIEHEYNDIARCIEACAPRPVDVIAHSYGALCALGAARMGARINRLVLYEPPIPTVTEPYYSPELIPLMREAVARGDASDAVSRFLAEVVGLRPEVIAAMRRVSAWKEQIAMLPLTLRELEEVGRFQLRVDDYSGWRTPTVLLVGEASPPRYHVTANALLACLAGGAIEVLPNQLHSAISAAPGLFVSATLRFLRPARDAIR